MILLWLSFAFTGLLQAENETNSSLSSPGQIALESTNAASTGNVSTNGAPATVTPTAPVPDQPPVAAPIPPVPRPSLAATAPANETPTPISGELVLAALMTLASLGGFLLYQCGLTRAKNCAHTSTLLLVGVTFGLIGFWIGGFAVQTGGVGDAHAALALPLAASEKSALDHELGFTALGHHLGFMGSSGFFLMTDDSARNSTAALFLSQAALLAIAVAAALGAALERGKILAMAIGAFLIGVLIYPLLANWVWGGGWLAQLGPEYGLGHGFIDLAGAGVVHQTAGTLALVIALVLGPRQGRFGRNNSSTAIPGHNVPFVLMGTFLLIISWTATNAFATASLETGSTAGLAAVNTMLAAAGSMLVTFLLAAWRKRRPEPALLCRGLLGGAVASCGCAALIDPWAAFMIGGVAGWLVLAVITRLERRRIDDPVGAIAVHGAGGAWGVLATGLFANDRASRMLNGVDGPVRGLFFGGAWHQLAAQVIGCVTGFVVVFILGYAFMSLIQKILGNRVDAADEINGLDWPQTGALGYQPDVEPENPTRNG